MSSAGAWPGEEYVCGVGVSPCDVDEERLCRRAVLEVARNAPAPKLRGVGRSGDADIFHSGK